MQRPATAISSPSCRIFVKYSTIVMLPFLVVLSTMRVLTILALVTRTCLQSPSMLLP
jgi:hypothetical protein